MAAKKTANPISRFVVYVFTTIVAPIVVSVVAGSVKENKTETPPRMTAPAATVTLLPPAPEPSAWESCYPPTEQKQTTTTARRHDEKK